MPTSVEGSHDGVGHIGMGEAEAVTQLVEDSLQQVRALHTHTHTHGHSDIQGG